MERPGKIAPTGRISQKKYPLWGWLIEKNTPYGGIVRPPSEKKYPLLCRNFRHRPSVCAIPRKKIPPMGYILGYYFRNIAINPTKYDIFVLFLRIISDYTSQNCDVISTKNTPNCQKIVIFRHILGRNAQNIIKNTSFSLKMEKNSRHCITNFCQKSAQNP